MTTTTNYAAMESEYKHSRLALLSRIAQLEQERSKLKPGGTASREMAERITRLEYCLWSVYDQSNELRKYVEARQ